MKKDLLFTFLTTAVVLISGLLVYKFAANLVGKNVFSQYAMCRKTISLISPVLLFGLTIGMPRYIAFASSSSEYQKADKYFLAGTLVLFSSVLFFTLLLNLFKGYFAFLFFGSSEYDNLILPVSIVIISLVFHATCYSYYRGKLLMSRANTLQIINSGVIPVLVFLWQKDIVHILLFTALFSIFTCTIVLIFIFKDLKWDKNVSLLLCSKELLYYSIQRVPGDFGLAAIMALPAIITAHITGIKEAGYVAFGTSILNMTGGLFSPIGIVLLPRASQLTGSKDIGKLKEYIKKLVSITFLITLAICIFFEIFANEIIRIYLGNTFSDMILVARIIMLGCLAFTMYVSMRSILDAYYVKAVNTFNIIISLVLFLIISFLIYVFCPNDIAIISAFVAALYILGFLTLFQIIKILKS